MERPDKYTGLPVYEDGRGFEVTFEDKRIFSLSEVPTGRLIALTDDRGRSYSFRAGTLSSTNVQAPDGSSKAAPFLEIRELSGDSLNGQEKIQSGLYLKDGTTDIQLHPPRETGQESPATKQGLRLVVNPWHVLRIAPSRIKIHEHSRTVVIEV